MLGGHFLYFSKWSTTYLILPCHYVSWRGNNQRLTSSPVFGSLSLFDREWELETWRDGFRMGLCGNINVGPEDFQMGVYFLEVVAWSLWWFEITECGITSTCVPSKWGYTMVYNDGRFNTICGWDLGWVPSCIGLTEILTYPLLDMFHHLKCTKCTRPKSH